MSIAKRISSLRKRLDARPQEIKLYIVDHFDGFYRCGDRCMNREEYEAWLLTLSDGRTSFLVVTDDYGDDLADGEA